MSTEKTEKRPNPRDSKGRFQTGNQTALGHGQGRPPVIKPVRELAKQHTEDAIKALVEIMNDKTSHASARVAAIKEVLDRGEGRVTQLIDTPADGALAGLIGILASGQHVLAHLQQSGDSDD